MRECQQYAAKSLHTSHVLADCVRRQHAELEITTSIAGQLYQDLQQSEEYILTLTKAIQQAGFSVPPPPKANPKADRDA